MDEIVGKMKKDIVFNTISADVIDPRTGRPGQATIAFSVSYKGRNPETVQRVASELASLYLEENLKTREKASAETSKFMEDERADVKAKMEALDAKIAVYKQKHGDSLPELAQVNMQGLDQVEREMSRVEDQLRALKERESNLEQQLVSVSPDTTNQERDSLRELRVRLIDLKSRYSDEYPDVIKTQAAIKELEARLAATGKRAQSTKPDNPAYITMASQLAGTRTEIDSVKRQVAESPEEAGLLPAAGRGGAAGGGGVPGAGGRPEQPAGEVRGSEQEVDGRAGGVRDGKGAARGEVLHRRTGAAAGETRQPERPGDPADRAGARLGERRWEQRP